MWATEPMIAPSGGLGLMIGEKHPYHLSAGAAVLSEVIKIGRYWSKMTPS
jgi:hypothetical protein